MNTKTITIKGAELPDMSATPIAGLFLLDIAAMRRFTISENGGAALEHITASGKQTALYNPIEAYAALSSLLPLTEFDKISDPLRLFLDTAKPNASYLAGAYTITCTQSKKEAYNDRAI